MALPHARQAIHEQVHSFKHHFPNKEFVSMFGEKPVMIGQLLLPFIASETRCSCASYDLSA